jgi:DNA replication protein DnaC
VHQAGGAYDELHGAAAPCTWARADKLFKPLKAARLDNTLDAEMRKLAGSQLLIIDDLALQRLDATETSDFYQLCV